MRGTFYRSEHLEPVPPSRLIYPECSMPNMLDFIAKIMEKKISYLHAEMDPHLGRIVLRKGRAEVSLLYGNMLIFYSQSRI